MKVNELKEFVRKLTDEDLKYLSVRFTQMLSGDRAEIVEFCSRNKDIDRFLSAASTSHEFFNLLDMVGDYVKKETSYRYEK